MAGGGVGNQGTYPFPNTNAGNQPTTPQPAQQMGGLQNWRARQQATDQQRQQYQQHLKDWYNSRPKFGQQPQPNNPSPLLNQPPQQQPQTYQDYLKSLGPIQMVAQTEAQWNASRNMPLQMQQPAQPGQLSNLPSSLGALALGQNPGQPPIPTGISSIPTTPTAPTPMPVAVAAPTPIVPPALAPTAPPPGSFQAMRAGGLATLRRR